MILSRTAYRQLSRLRAATNRTPVLRSGCAQGALARLRRLLFASLDDGFRLRMDGVSLWFPTSFKPHYVKRDYEPLTRAWLERELKPGMTAVDVGAHVGFLAVTMGRLVGPSGCVLAFEPAQENLRYLRDNVVRNGLDHVKVLPFAVGSTATRRRFNITGSSDSHGFYPHPLTKTLCTVEMEQVALDDEPVGSVDLVKIDVEGAEIEVLDGMRNTLAANPGIRILVEWNPACMRSAGYEADALPRRLEELGFTMVVLDDKAGEVRNLDAVRRELAAGPVAPSWYVNLAGRREHAR